MRLFDLSFDDPKKNLSFDDELLYAADKEKAGEALRFWESSSYFVVLGRTCKEDEDVHGAVCQKDGIPVFRRLSGGGTVLQGPGCMNFSLVLSRTQRGDVFSISRSYVYILSKVVDVLKTLGVDAAFRPVCDLVLSDNECKFSGNAQRRGRNYILHHGTILYDFNLALVSKYLKMPLKMPDYRRERMHKDFVTNISVDLPLLKSQLARVWEAKEIN